MRRRRTLPLLLAVAALVSGCELEDPYEQRAKEQAASATTVPAAPVNGELPNRDPRLAPEPGSFPEAGPTPGSTLRRAAELAGNWSTETAAAGFRRLTYLSAGHARAEFQQIAATADTEARGGSSSRASVEAIDVQGEGGKRRGVVVTRERIETPELPHLPAEYRVTVATLERRGDRWVITTWEPKP